MKYSIVIGAVNEASLIKDSLSRLKEWLTDNSLLNQTEVVLVTAEGRDNTPELAAKHITRLKHYQHIQPGARVGKGRDIRLGMMAAKGDYILYMDADLATPLPHIKTIFETVERGADVAIGVRSLSSIHNTLGRRVTSLLSNTAIKMLIWQNISDTQCGFKAFSKTAAKKLFTVQNVDGWSFDAEVLALCRKLGYKIVQVQIKDWKDPKPAGEGLVGDSQLKAMLNSLIDLLKVRINLIFGKYNE